MIEKAEWGHSAFTLNLLRGLQEWMADLNMDGVINILDVIMMINIILDGDEYPPMGDMNGDGGIDILDVIILVNVILNGG